jgi:hypothetical protein
MKPLGFDEQQWKMKAHAVFHRGAALKRRFLVPVALNALDQRLTSRGEAE